MIADMHCDTLSEIRHMRAKGEQISLLDSEKLHVNLNKMREGGYVVQNFAAFIFMGNERDPFEDAMELVQLFESEMQANAEWIRPVTTVAEIEANAKEGKLSALLTLEEGGMCKGEVEKLEEFYRHGARMMTLTWNFDNELATPALPITGDEESDSHSFAPDPTLPGLKRKGFQIVEAMESLGMIPDVSHLSDAGFYDVCKTCRKPFVASHSNARAISNHARNLSDDMLRQLGEHGGVAGLNYYPEFIMEPSDFAAAEKILSGVDSDEADAKILSGMDSDKADAKILSGKASDETDRSQAEYANRQMRKTIVSTGSTPTDRIEQPSAHSDKYNRTGQDIKAIQEELLTLLAKHARHMANCGGVGGIGLGSDFDGFGGLSVPSGADRVGDLAWALHRSGFSDGEVDGILYKNVLRVYRDVLR